MVFANKTNHVIVELFLLVHGDCQIGFTNSGKQPDKEMNNMEVWNDI